jgi:hypothetical protein
MLKVMQRLEEVEDYRDISLNDVNALTTDPHRSLKL